MQEHSGISAEVAKEATAVHMGGRDLSNRLQVPEQTLAVWRMKGYGPAFFKVGRHVRYRLSDVLAWEQEQLEASA